MRRKGNGSPERFPLGMFWLGIDYSLEVLCSFKGSHCI
jgi:hypothetical protein